MGHFRWLVLSFIVVVLLAGAWRTEETSAQNRPLTYPEIVTALNTAVPNSAFRTKAQLIAFLIKDIERRRVDKPLTSDREDDLRQAGATENLIAAIKANSPLPATPTPTPTPTPKATPAITPTPLRTPKPTPTPVATRPRVFRNTAGMDFVLIPGGTFTIGSPANERGRMLDEGPQHQVAIGYDFYMGKFEVTQAQWRSVMGSDFDGMSGLHSEFFGDDMPVVRIAWVDAKAFVDRLNEIDNRYTYRLPSEAEWEYAERAGTETRFYWGDDSGFFELCRYANVKDFQNCDDGHRFTARVGSYQPNAFGLYDMDGNVWEWCEDIWQPGYTNVPTDGSPNLTYGDQRKRTQRGGSWADPAAQARSASRGGDSPTDRNDEDGFRLVAIPKVRG